MGTSPNRWTDLRGLVILPLLALVALLVLRNQLGFEADPLRICVAFLAGLIALIAAICFPAAFVAPVLFLPSFYEISGISALSGMGPAEDWTELYVICGLLIAGLALRSFWRGSRAVPAAQGYERQSMEEAAPQLVQQRLSRRALFAFLIFAAMVSISYAYTISPNYGQQKLLGFLTLGCGLFVLPALLFAGRRDFRDFTIGAAIFGFVVAAVSLKFSASGAMAFGENASHIGRGQAIGLAMLVLLYAPVTGRRLRAVILLFFIPFLAIGLVSAESRGPLFSLLLVVVLSFFVPSMRSSLIARRQMVFAAVVLVGAVMFLSAFWFYGTSESKFEYKTAEIVALAEGSGEAQGTAVERLQYYRAAAELFLERPVFGHGLGSWSMLYWRQDIRQYPHNLFFEVLVEQGLAGFLALFIFLTAVFRQLRANVTAISGRFPCLLPCLVYLLSIAMFSGDLNDDRFLWFWCSLSLVTCALAQHVKNESSRFVNESKGHGISQLAPTQN